MFSYGADNKIVLDQHPVVQLVGKNGAGKSSIPLILEELLFNKNSKGIKKGAILNRYCGDNKYYGTVRFSKGHDEYVLQKTVASTAKVKLTKNGQDVSGHTTTQTYKLLETDILGIDFKTFSKLVYQSMTSALDFLQATDANRKKFLMSLLNLEEYGLVLERLKEKNKEYTQTRDEIVGKLDVIESFLSQHKEELDIIELVDVPEVDDSLAEQAGALGVDRKQIAKHNESVRAKKALTQKLERLLKMEPDSPPTEDDLAQYNSEKQRLSSEYDQVNLSVLSLKRQIDELSGLHENCPTCGQPIEDNANISNKLENLKQELSRVDTRDKIRSELRKLIDPNPAIKDYDAWKNDVDKLKTDLYNIFEDIGDDYLDDKDLEAKIEELKSEYQRQKAAQQEANVHNSKAVAHNSRAESINERIKQYRDKISDMSKDKTENDEILADYKVLLEAFGPKGLVQYKIESNIKSFEQLINDYLVKLSSGTFNITFSMEESKLSINVYQEGELVDISSVSSGEFNNINTATLLAVRSMMSAISKASINLLFLDEVISVLDEDARTNLIDILLEERGLNSITVSHGFTHPLAHIVQVEKENKISCIQ